MGKNTHYVDFSNANADKISSASTMKEEAKQRAKNYMRLKDGYVEPKDVVLGDKTALVEDVFYQGLKPLPLTYSIPIYENGIKTEWAVDGIVGDEKYQQLIEMTPESKLPSIINTTTK